MTPCFPRLCRAAALAAIASASLSVPGASAAVLIPTDIDVSTPDGSNDTTSPFTDDVLLDRLEFGTGAAFDSGDSFRAISRFRVESGATEINAEWGDDDDGDDGDDNPFVKAGIVGPGDDVTTGPDGLQETTDAATQNATLTEAFNSLSLSEMSDGEGADTSFSFRVLFDGSLTDNAAGDDLVPEIVFFERGMNDVFDVRLITGGTFDSPEFTDFVEVNSDDFWASGISVNTQEIDDAQEIGIGGFDLDTFGVVSGQPVFGFELSAAAGEGPDLNGFFLSSEDPDRFGDPLTAVPLPPSALFLLSGLGLAALVRRRRPAA